MLAGRFFLGILIVLAASGLGLPGAFAQGVGVDDLAGLRLQVNRTFTGSTDLASAPLAATTPREAAKPEVLLLLVSVFRYDSEASAAAGYELLRNDINATGIDNTPLPLSEVELDLDVPHTARTAVETRAPVPVDFLLAVMLDGDMTHVVIAITRGVDPQAAVTRVAQLVVAAPVGSGAEVFAADGGSTGGLWDKVPTRGLVGRYMRGVTTVIDDEPFRA